MCHALDCNKVGLITARHNNLRYGVSDLSGKAFTPTHVRDDPKTFTGRIVQGGGVQNERQISSEGKGGNAAGGGGVEGGPTDPGSLESGDGQHSRHACC